MSIGTGGRAAGTAAENEQALSALVDRLRAASGQDSVTVKDAVDAVGRRSLLPLLLVPALVAATPLSGIPGLSALSGILIALISFQLLMSYDEVRLPRRLSRYSVEGDALRKALEKSRPVIGLLDRFTRPRLTVLFHRPIITLAELLCLASGLLMPFLEVIPFSASFAASGVCLLALAQLTRDGLLLLLALLPYAALAALFL